MIVARTAIFLLMIGWASLAVYPINTATAEMAVGGEKSFKTATQAASAKLNEALSSLHLLLAALDSGKIESAEKFKQTTLSQMMAAASAYRKATEFAGNRILRPNPQNEKDKADVRIFFRRLDLYKIVRPISQKNVIDSIPRIVRNFASVIEKTDLKRLARNIREQQDFFKAALQMQFFLNSVTTIFRIG